MFRIDRLLFALPAILVPLSCNVEAPVQYELENDGAVQTASPDEGSVNAGRLMIKVSDELAIRLEAEADDKGIVDACEMSDLSSAGVVRLHRLFPEAGKFEERTRAAGLHKWYVAEYDAGCSLTKAGDSISSLPGVDDLEYDYRIEIVGNPRVISIVTDSYRNDTKSGSDYPFDDPILSSQWHYRNSGSGYYAVSGCDINVFPVWKRYTAGDPDIVVAVVDEGVDFDHEDLSDNMWNNPDWTGDAKYGYNFVTDSYQVTPGEHGTHVAGTIAAVNNNGLGCCGVAGGDFAAGEKGVKIMSCQIFDGDEGGSGAAAIKWACDHGAVIAQNSWGYTEPMDMPESLKAAVDYFVKYAGLDENGAQTGPMAGGLVVFAAGNEDSDKPYGTNYEKVINVASVGADYKRAYYSCYGSWVDITAPGGDAQKGKNVLSTLPDDKYGYMQGTSMACPHASGVAALILSKNKKQGFTADELKEKLLSGATDISAYNPRVSMGKGLVNAYKSIAGTSSDAPCVPTSLKASGKSNSIEFSVRIPEDPDDWMPSSIYIYWSKEDFTDPSKAASEVFSTEGYDVGDVIGGTVTGLEFDTQYYVAAAACDFAGNHSPLTGRVRVLTENNNPPEIRAKDGTDVSLKAHQSAKLSFEIVEPDGHSYDISFDAPNEAASLDTLNRAKPVVTVTGIDAPEGSYTAILKVTDVYGLSAACEIHYTILPNHPPVTIGKIDNVLFNSVDDQLTLNASDYFTDEDGEELDYTLYASDRDIVECYYSEGEFTLYSMDYGYSEVYVSATDIRGESVTQTFTVLVRDGSKDIEVYPNAVYDKLYVRTGAETECQVKIAGRTGAVVYSGSHTISPFEPLAVDMSSNSPGVYTVIVRYGESEVNTKIVKY